MIVKTLSGQLIKWNPKSKIRKNPSKLHLEAREILKEEFPCMRIYEEVHVPKVRIYFDFYVPTEKIVIEVQGQQHYQYNSYYYESKLDYYSSLRKDREKKEFCELNSIKLIELPWNKKNEWRDIIKSGRTLETNRNSIGGIQAEVKTEDTSESRNRKDIKPN